MQIHYLWVQDFGRLRKAGINLSAQFIFEMEKSESDGYDYILRIEENPNYIANFFEKSEIANITAIIGKNGAGKSSILRYMRTHLPKGLSSRNEHDLIIYSHRNNLNKEDFWIIIPGDLKVKQENKTSTQFIVDPSYFVNPSNAEYIYYTYLLDFNEDNHPWKGLTNLSTAFLMMEDRRRIEDENRDEKIKTGLLARCNDLDNMHMSEVARAIQFLRSGPSLPFQKPEYLLIEIDLDDIQFFTTKKEQYKDLNTLFEAIDKRLDYGGNIVNDLVVHFALSIFINFLFDEYRFGFDHPHFRTFPPLSGHGIVDYIVEYFSGMAGITFSVDGRSGRSEKHDRLSKLVPEFIELLAELINKGTIIPDSDKKMRLVLNEQTESVFKAFSSFYLQIKGLNTFLNFRWRSLSGGEQSFLSFMSRFYHVRHHSHGDLPKDLVILIDEGDTGYHPEWQRKFFNNVLQFLSALFKGYSLQIIITANMPFLSSDLPNAHVLFIEWLDEKVSIFHSKSNNRELTFAANIHTLFSNSFYMDGVLMGEFAKAKINKIIDYLNSPTIQNEEPNATHRKTIDMIGEPVIRKKLQDMWNEKFGLDEELILLRKRILEIENLKSANQA